MACYITDATVRAKWKALPKIAATNFPAFIWESGAKFPDGDGEVNGTLLLGESSGGLRCF